MRQQQFRSRFSSRSAISAFPSTPKLDLETIPTINVHRVSLRAVADSDVESLYSIYSDAEVMRYWGASPMKDPQEAKDFLAEVLKDLRGQQCIQWGIARRTDNQIIGTIALFHFDIFARKAEIGFALGRAHWGMGYMQEALQAAIGYAFNEMNFRRIEADVDPRNLSSIRLLEGLGFRKEGYFRERWLAGEETQDTLFYGLLKKEWNSLSNVYQVVSASALTKPEYLGDSYLRRWAGMILGLFSS